MKDSSLKYCPVPPEQQPLNEYQQLKESGFFQWATLEKTVYQQKLTWVWGWGWLIAGPIAAASFHPQKEPVSFMLVGSAGAGLLVALVLARLYLGWSYIRSRLYSEKIFYEESGWYDGQTWKKPPEVLTRERLIATYEIQPILERLQQTTKFLITSVSVGGLIWLGKSWLT